MLQATDQPSGVDQLTVLVAGGNDTGLAAMLARHGFEVVADAHDADEAVQRALEQRPQLCLIDVELPGGGIAASREICAKLPDTRVAVLTRFADEEEALRTVRAGADGYLLKSLAPDRLSQALRAITRGEPALPRTLTARLVRDLREAQPFLETRPAHGPINRAILYAPRFLKHFRRRLRSNMPASAAWQSARVRMRQYRQPRELRS